jgi:hypothetical protein
VATAARDSAAQRAVCPAEDVWWLHRRPGAALRLADLADAVLDNRDDRAA